MYELKDLVWGYRKYRNETPHELAKELDVPISVIDGLEMGSFKHPNSRLMKKIEDVTEDLNKEELGAIGRGYRIRATLGSDFKYYLLGMRQKTGINPKELQKMTLNDCHKTIGQIPFDYHEIAMAGRELIE
ncbi:hypothetical protein [Methanobacterium alcaliphilum]|uniref:hypothetical protein n=1 Tax=Methanobacterium alcaliphilum TaxID=392018 RepID=UPI00200A4957|nr:hypothetical protein [Methanobacterium alcaliphilum]MCK9151476.1 hypothetical protein [Methanobacterium alcaliphilum]